MSESLEERYKRKEAEMWARMRAGWDTSNSFYRDEQTPAGSCHGISSTTAAELKKILEDMKPAINVGRSWQNAYVVMPPEMMAHAMKIEPVMFQEPEDRPLFKYLSSFNGMPIYNSWPARFLYTADSGLAKEPVETTPVLPRLMTWYVPEVKQRDLSFWQAMVCVVVLGWILVSLGGAL